MKLYYTPGACSLADHIALLETGLEFTSEQVDLKTGKTASGEDYKALNPKGYVPMLVLDDGNKLTENIAVLAYLADRSGKLMPAQGIAHWRVLEMLAFISTELHKAFKPFFKPAASQAEKDEAADILSRRFAYLNDQLGSRDFIVGEALTVADCYLFVMLMWAKKFAPPLPSGLAAYFDRLGQRPAFERALREEGLA